jgi:hypothetical protein
MRTTIMAQQDMVLIMALSYKSDCSALRTTNVDVVQWEDTSSTGVVQYVGGSPADLPITDFTPYQTYVTNATRISPSINNQ